jgi:hypothetical protein
MGYLGYKPADKPLTAADITDSIITSAKIVDATITNSDVASSIITGQTAETSIADADTLLIYDDSATALRKMTKANLVAGIGGTNTPAFYAYSALNQAQAVSTSTNTKLNFQTELYDTDNAFASNTTFTVPSNKAGKYQFTANISWYHSGGAFSRAYISLYKNGSEHLRFERRGTNIYLGGYSQNSLNFTTDDNASVGDYYEVYGFFDGITETYTSSGPPQNNFFKAFKIIT